MSKVIPIRKDIGGDEGWQFHPCLVKSDPKRRINWDKLQGFGLLTFCAGMMVIIIWQVGRVL